MSRHHKKTECTTLATTLILISTMASAAVPPPSPCQDTFSYDSQRYTTDSWQGNVNLPLVENREAVKVDIQLSNKVHVLANFAGEVTSRDNTRFKITIDSTNVQRPLTFLVRFNPKHATPRLISILLNGVVICSERSTSFTTPTTSTTLSPYYPSRPTTRFPSLSVETPEPLRPSISRPTYTQPSYVTKGTTPSTTTRPSKSKKCGISAPSAASLIVYGETTARGQWPWHVAIYNSEGVDLRYKCGGSLVAPSTIITAAHCVTVPRTNYAQKPESLVIFLGKYHRLQWGEEGVQQKRVKEIYVSPAYNFTSFLGDVAVVKLSDPAEYTDFVRPLCVGHYDLLTGKIGTVVGWGIDETGEQSEDLRKTELPVVSDARCFESNPDFFGRFKNENTFCAGLRNGTSVCNGDSGGGLVFQKSGQFYLRGIVSVALATLEKRCDPRHYTLFTDVDRYLPWAEPYIE